MASTSPAPRGTSTSPGTAGPAGPTAAPAPWQVRPARPGEAQPSATEGDAPAARRAAAAKEELPKCGRDGRSNTRAARGANARAEGEEVWFQQRKP